MGKLLKRKGPLAVSSREQDRLAQQAQTIFENLQTGKPIEKPKIDIPSAESPNPKQNMCGLHESLDGLGALVNLRMTKEGPPSFVRDISRSP